LPPDREFADSISDRTENHAEAGRSRDSAFRRSRGTLISGWVKGRLLALSRPSAWSARRVPKGAVSETPLRRARVCPGNEDGRLLYLPLELDTTAV
jgi:hypothetical protein